MKDLFASLPLGMGIVGTGYALGPNRLSNDDLMRLSGLTLSERFIRSRIGIESRCFLADGMTTSDLAVAAARQALDNADCSLDELDRLIVATSTPDHATPSTACIVQHKLGGSGFPAHDVVAACSGFLYGLEQALRCVATGDRKVLVIGADCRSRTLNLSDKRTAFLYGDGAGAVVVSALPGRTQGFEDCLLMADGSGFDAVMVPAGGAAEPCTEESIRQGRHRLSMPDGARVATNAAQGFIGLTEQLLERNALRLEDIDFFVFHQPNGRLLQKVIEQLGVPPAKTHINFPRYGNTVAGSVPIALAEAVAEGKIGSGDRVLLCAVGAGFTGGAALLRWH
ncbi:hypothetical protein CAI21_19280 [Alkalilimnicola ehrlichii]|uniref:3-oxoacyl-ACP synthase III family protein n=1 Tax=Alkalilimnicola ehrlichii TaxID=351052 RepID=UPI000E2F8C06|nr:ketoacyl-ACP synthase III [Alkalilimnicola ehrlichii]RFA25378.1 hypothetical protein CAI21_19280 [Alkalilimnicola ehrlichii]